MTVIHALSQTLWQALNDQRSISSPEELEGALKQALDLHQAQLLAAPPKPNNYSYQNTMRQLTRVAVKEFPVLFERFKIDLDHYQWDLNKQDNRRQNAWSIISKAWPTTNKKGRVTETKREALRQICQLLLDRGINPLDSEVPIREFYGLNLYLLDELQKRENSCPLRDKNGNNYLHLLVGKRGPSYRIEAFLTKDKLAQEWVNSQNHDGLTPLQLVWLNGDAQFTLDHRHQILPRDFQDEILSLWVRTQMLLDLGADLLVSHPEHGLLLDHIQKLKEQGLEISKDFSHPHGQEEHSIAWQGQEHHRVALEKYALNELTQSTLLIEEDQRQSSHRRL